MQFLETPDVSTYVYDQTSGYYFDPISTLYYDGNSQYYYNRETQQYMYWSGEHETFLPAPDNQDTSEQKSAKKGKKRDKPISAKRIAKDMEKWAKTMNQRKEADTNTQIPADSQGHSSKLTKIDIGSSKNKNPDIKFAGAEDIAFSIVNKGEGSGMISRAVNLQPSGFSTLDHIDEPPPPGSRIFPFKTSSIGLTGLASYNSDSEEEANGSSKATTQRENHTDWEKLACLLCRRQFPSEEKLTK